MRWLFGSKTKKDIKKDIEFNEQSPEALVVKSERKPLFARRAIVLDKKFQREDPINFIIQSQKGDTSVSVDFNPPAIDLRQYNIVIIEYNYGSLGHGVALSHDNFWRQTLKGLMTVLTNGGTIVFLCDGIPIPRFDPKGKDNLNVDDVIDHLKNILGFHFLWRLNVLPKKFELPLPDFSSKHFAFSDYINNFAIGDNYFVRRKGNDQPLNKICTFTNENLVGGFHDTFKKGNIFVLPYLLEDPDNKRKNEFISTLVTAVIRYLESVDGSRPLWLDGLLSRRENELLERRNILEGELKAIGSELEKISEEEKSILYKKDDALRWDVVRFMKLMGLNIESTEKYKEDFWILNEEGNNVAIGEIKGYDKDISKKDIFQLSETRRKYELPNGFPGLFVINSYAKAGSMDEKDKPIENLIVKIAVEENTLIVRTLDLYFLKKLKDETPEKVGSLKELLTTNKGWLRVNLDGYQIVQS